MNTFPTLYTKHCILREISQDEIPILREIIEDEQFQRFLPELYDTVKTEEGLIQLMRHFDTYVQNEDGALWGIETEGALAGFVAIMDISYDPILFYAMHPNYRNHGYAKEAVSEVVAYYRTMSKAPLHTEVYSLNQASLAVLTFCGFKIVGNIDNKFLLKMQDELTFREKVSI